MNILNKLSKLGAIVALTASVVAFPAVAQHNGGGFKTHKVSKFSGQRGRSFRGNRGSSFRGNRGRNFRSNRGFNNRGRSSFRGNNSFNRGFRNNSFRGRSSFNNRRFYNNGFNNGFRGNSFRGHNGRGFRNNVVVVSPAYAVGGFYGNTNNTVFISDFASHGLYVPPRGYHWVCDKGSSNAILAAVATGAIIAVAVDVLATPY